MSKANSYFKEGQRYFGMEDKGSVPLVGLEGLLRAVFGVSQKDIHYPPPGIHGTGHLPVCRGSSQLEEWLTGFWEGDGTYGRESHTIGMYQRYPQVLLDIAEELECGLVIPMGKMWHIYFSTTQTETLLEIFSRHLVCPKRLRQLDTPFGDLGLTASLHIPTRDWFVGFWDAEGHSYSGGSSWHLGVSQKDKYVLEAIRGLWNFGEVWEASWSWRVSKEEERRAVGDFLLRYSRNTRKKLKLIADAGLPLSSLI